MILARFHDGAAMDAAGRQLDAQGVKGVESFGPEASETPRHSRLPALMTGMGIAAAAGTFAMQAYATTVGYRLDIGGRPDLFWPSYLPFSIEAGMLTAMLTGFVGFLVAARLPALHDPVDEGADFATVSRDGWFLAIPGRPDGVDDSLRAAAFVEALPE